MCYDVQNMSAEVLHPNTESKYNLRERLVVARKKAKTIRPLTEEDLV